VPHRPEDGGLGIDSVTRADVLPGWRLDDDCWQRFGFDDWNALRATVAAGAGQSANAMTLCWTRCGRK
jgi:hypothetical protein